jgi:hypothetical protein
LTKPSATRPPLSSWTFFTDRDLGNVVPDALLAAGYNAVRHDQIFGPRTRDEEWLPIVAERGWLALSHNKRIRRVPVERDAAMRSGLALFLLIGKMPHGELAKNVVATAPRIVEFREKHQPPFIARVSRPETKFAIGSRPGTVELALSESQWRELLRRGR